MSKHRHDYDPGEPNDGPPPRRRRRDYRTEGEYDDAWAAAGDDAAEYGVPPESLAAGYAWDDEQRLGVRRPGDDLGPLPPSADRLTRRGGIPRHERIRRRYDRNQAYDRSPSYHLREGQRPPPRVIHPQQGYSLPARLAPGVLTRNMPAWAVFVLVALAMAALGAALLACLAVMFLL